jgi:hypothetical protein
LDEQASLALSDKPSAKAPVGNAPARRIETSGGILKTKTAALAAILTLAAAPASYATHSTGKAGAPGQVCKLLRVKGKKASEQRAARKLCIKTAAQARGADRSSAETPAVGLSTPAS